MLSLSRIIFRRPPCVALTLGRFSASAGGDGQGGNKPQPATRSIWAASPPVAAAGAATRPKKTPAREAADAPAGSSDGPSAAPRRTGSWRPGQQQQRPSAAGSWRPGVSAAPPPSSPRSGSAGGWKPMGNGVGDAAGSAADYGADMDLPSGGDGGRRRIGFSGKRRSSSAEGANAPHWKRGGQEGGGGGGGKFAKGRGGGRAGSSAGWGSAKERVDSVTGRENYFSALISAKRTTKVTKGGKTRTAQVRLERALLFHDHHDVCLLRRRRTFHRRLSFTSRAGCCGSRRLRRQRWRGRWQERREEQGQAEVQLPLFLS